MKLLNKRILYTFETNHILLLLLLLMLRKYKILSCAFNCPTQRNATTFLPKIIEENIILLLFEVVLDIKTKYVFSFTFSSVCT